MTRLVIDASAVIAVLRGERGADFIAPLCPSAIMSTVNLQEAIKALTIRGGSLDLAKAMIDGLQLEICPHSENDAYVAASLVQLTAQYGSGLGDRTCMALGISLNLPVLTTDKAWAKLSIPRLQVLLAR